MLSEPPSTVTALTIAFHVPEPQMPSAVRPLSFWNCLTTAAVPDP